MLISADSKSMDEPSFWKMIEATSVRSSIDTDQLASILEQQLSKMSRTEVIDFEIILREKIFEADHFNVMVAQKIIDGYVSDDSYLYFRCWLISLGKEAFYGTIKSTDYLAGIINKDITPEFENLLYITTSAFSKITNKEEDDSFPRNIAADKGLNYDALGLETKGEDWTEEDLPKRAPKLFNMFRTTTKEEYYDME